MARHWFHVIALAVLAVVGYLSLVWRPARKPLIVVAPLPVLRLYDLRQRCRTVLRNCPVIGHGRYMVESIRP